MEGINADNSTLMELNEVQITTNESITRLQELWRTEVNAPEILPFNMNNKDLVDTVLKLLRDQQVCMTA